MLCSITESGQWGTAETFDRQVPTHHYHQMEWRWMLAFPSLLCSPRLAAYLDLDPVRGYTGAPAWTFLHLWIVADSGRCLTASRRDGRDQYLADMLS